mgnify:CR=1 FL=1
MGTPDPRTRAAIRHFWQREIAADRKFPRKPDPTVNRTLAHGWLLPYLLQADRLTWGRWDYWYRLMQSGRLPAEPIPPIEFSDTPARGTPAHKMLEACLNTIPTHGVWQSWSSWSYFDFFMDWLLYGFGHPGQPESPPEPAGCAEASNRLYQVFCLEALLAWPDDYWGDILAENKHGRGLGFYPTPLNVVRLMVQMLLAPSDDGQDLRTRTVLDPCLGTGRMLLLASNYSLRLYGADINPTVIKASLVNGYLYAPWLVRPIPWLDRDTIDPARSAAISDAMVQAGAGNPAAAEYLAGSEHDGAQQWRFEPLKKRRRPSPNGTPAANPSFAELYCEKVPA